MKKSLIILLAALMVVSLTACGGQSAPPASSQAVSDASSAEPAAWVPTQDIEFVIPFSVGGGNDIFVRKMAEIIQRNKMCPVNIVTVNKPGGSGVVGFTYLTSKGKGYEYALASTSASFYTQPLTGNSPLTSDSKSFSFVAHMVKEPTVLVAVPSRGFKTLQDMVDYAKAHPGELKYAGTGIISDDAIIMHMLNDIYGINLVYVPFDSAGEMIAAMLGGHVDMGVMAPAEALEHMQNGSLPPLASCSDERLEVLPDVPTFLELGVDMNHQASRGIVMNADVAPEVQAYYSDLFKRVSETQEWQDFVKASAMDSVYMDYEEYAKFSAELNEKYATYLGMISATQK